MPPPLLRRCIANPSSLFSHRLLNPPISSLHLRAVSTKRKGPKSVLVQLTKNVKHLGHRGDVVTVKHGRMRNLLYPYSLAQYIHPGKGTFLTQEMLSLPFQPGYRAMLRRRSPDPARAELRKLFDKTRERLLEQEKKRPGVDARGKVLEQIQQFRTLISESKEWRPDQRRELSQFLNIQAASWRLLGDEYWRTSVGRAKEAMLFATWKKFTKGMEKPPGRRVMNKVVATTTKVPKKSKKKGTKVERSRKPTGQKAPVQNLPSDNEVVVGKASKEAPVKNVKKKKSLKDPTLEQELSTSGTIVQADVTTIKKGVDTPIGSKKVVGQTVVHSTTNPAEKQTEKDVTA